MSETPIVPVLDKRSEDIQVAASLKYELGEVNHDFAEWEKGVDSESTINLDREDVLRPGLWQTDAELVAEPVRATELSHVEVLRNTFNRMSHKEVVRDIAIVTANGIVDGLRLHPVTKK